MGEGDTGVVCVWWWWGRVCGGGTAHVCELSATLCPPTQAHAPLPRPLFQAPAACSATPAPHPPGTSRTAPSPSAASWGASAGRAPPPPAREAAAGGAPPPLTGRSARRAAAAPPKLWTEAGLACSRRSGARDDSQMKQCHFREKTVPPPSAHLLQRCQYIWVLRPLRANTREQVVDERQEQGHVLGAGGKPKGKER